MEFFSALATALWIVSFFLFGWGSYALIRAVYGAGFASGFSAAIKHVDPEPEVKRADPERKNESFPEPDEVADEEDDLDICLRVGMPVTCVLSNTTHTHGVILGFSIGPSGSMVAIVDVGGLQLMPIDVDMVEPREPAEPLTYRDNTDPKKEWN